MRTATHDSRMKAVQQRLHDLDIRSVVLRSRTHMDTGSEQPPHQAIEMLNSLVGPDLDNPIEFAHFLDVLIDEIDPERNIVVKGGASAALAAGAAGVAVVAGALVIDYILYNEFGDGSGYSPGSGYGAAYDKWKSATN